MDKIFSRLVGNNFSELPGLMVDAFVPVPENLVNEILQVTLRGNKTITYTRVSIHSDNRVIADVKSPLLPWTLHLRMKLFHSVDFTGAPKLRAFLENNLLLSKLGSLFHALPKGVALYNNQIAMDVEELTPPEHKQFLTLVKAVDIQTEEGKVILKVKLVRDMNLPVISNKG
jgi:hypothetical protein